MVVPHIIYPLPNEGNHEEEEDDLVFSSDVADPEEKVVVSLPL
jgi:hypothetical protein